MAYLSDIEIAQRCQLKPIAEIAKTAHVDEKYLEFKNRFTPYEDGNSSKRVLARVIHES